MLNISDNRTESLKSHVQGFEGDEDREVLTALANVFGIAVMDFKKLGQEVSTQEDVLASTVSRVLAGGGVGALSTSPLWYLKYLVSVRIRA